MSLPWPVCVWSHHPVRGCLSLGGGLGAHHWTRGLRCHQPLPPCRRALLLPCASPLQTYIPHTRALLRHAYVLKALPLTISAALQTTVEHT